MDAMGSLDGSKISIFPGWAPIFTFFQKGVEYFAEHDPRPCFDVEICVTAASANGRKEGGKCIKT